MRGYVWREKFYGAVLTAGDTLYIEPLEGGGPVGSHTPRTGGRPVNAYVYRVFSRAHGRARSAKTRRTRRRLARTRRRRQSRRRRPGGCRSCGLLLVADPSFHAVVGGGSVKASVLQMLHHSREAGLVLAGQDWDRDGQADCLGLTVSGLAVITKPESHNNVLLPDSKSAREYLHSFSRYQLDGYCLAVLFSALQFPGAVLGLSWRAELSGATSGGICTQR